MKILKTSGVLLLIALAIFWGFNYFSKSELLQSALAGKENENTQSDFSSDSSLELKYYAERLAALETELSTLKRDKYNSEQKYLEQIRQLESKIEEGDTSSTSPEVKNTVYTYAIIDGKATITGYSGDDKILLIPSEINGASIVAIGESAFAGASVEQVIIPSTVEHIGWFAFGGCSRLKGISIPPCTTKIEYGAFDGCAAGLSIYCEKDSYADRYARSYGMNVVND